MNIDTVEEQLFERYAELDQKVAEYREEMMMLEGLLVSIASRRDFEEPADEHIQLPSRPHLSRKRAVAALSQLFAESECRDEIPPADPFTTSDQKDDDDDKATRPIKRRRSCNQNVPAVPISLPVAIQDRSPTEPTSV